MMSGGDKQLTASRELKQRFHGRRVRLWNILLFMANGLFPITLVFAATPFLILAMFVDEVFINNKYSHAYQLIIQFCWSLVMGPAIISFGWWVLVNIREIRDRHVRLAAGYAQKSAEEALAKTRSEGRPFGLFLRGFEWEAASTTYHGPNPDIVSREAEVHAPRIESLLVEMLEEDVPLLALTNPRDPEPMPGVYRFESVPEKWEQFVDELLPDAFPIVMHLTSLTSGIRMELGLISPPAYSSKTVIVVGRGLAIRNSPGGEEVLKLLPSSSHIVFEQINEDWSRGREVEFHARLHRDLLTLESASQAKTAIVRKGAGNFTVYTPTRLQRIINFMKGPTLSVSFILILMFLIPLLVGGGEVKLVGGREVSKALTLIERLALALPVSILALGALKGLTYLLGFAQVLGEQERFPTFSRMLKWVKKHSVTPE